MIRLLTIIELEPLSMAQLRELEAKLYNELAQTDLNACERAHILASLANITRLHHRRLSCRTLQ